MKTTEQVKADFCRKGISIASWARAQGFGRLEVYRVINGKAKARRGKAHKIAVLLGMKDGEITER